MRFGHVHGTRSSRDIAPPRILLLRHRCWEVVARVRSRCPWGRAARVWHMEELAQAPAAEGIVCERTAGRTITCRAAGGRLERRPAFNQPPRVSPWGPIRRCLAGQSV